MLKCYINCISSSLIIPEQHFSTDAHSTVVVLQVFFYVSSTTVDLSMFGSEQATLIQHLRSAHRSVRFQPLPQQRQATIEGPFSAVQALREDLICRASQLPSTVQAQNETLQQQQPPNSRAISHPEFGSVSCRKGNQGSAELSTPQQTTGEATEQQSSYAEPASSPQTVSYESLLAGRPSCVKALDKIGSSQSATEDKFTQEAKADTRQVFGKSGINGETTSVSLGLDRPPAEEISTNQPGLDDVSHTHSGQERISATGTKPKDHFGSVYSTDYLRDSDQSSSTAAANLGQTRFKDVSPSSVTDTEGAEQLSAARPEEQKDECIWVDSDTFRYIQKFNSDKLDSCFRCLDASIKCDDDAELTQILWSSKQTSKTATRIQLSLDLLEGLVEYWQPSLRVHWIHFDEDEQPEKKKLVQICDDVNSTYDDVLYMFGDRCIKVIGPSRTSYLFYMGVKERLSLQKDPYQYP